MIPKEKINDKLIARLQYIEYQEDIWFIVSILSKCPPLTLFVRRSTLKEIFLTRTLEQLAHFQKESDWGK